MNRLKQDLVDSFYFHFFLIDKFLINSFKKRVIKIEMLIDNLNSVQFFKLY